MRRLLLAIPWLVASCGAPASHPSTARAPAAASGVPASKRPTPELASPGECSDEAWASEHAKAVVDGPMPGPDRFASSACVVRTAKGFVEWVTIRPIGALPFVVRVEGLPVSALPAAPDAASAVEVGGPLHFYGLARLETLGMRAGVPLAAGMVQSGSRTRVVAIEPKGSELLGDVQLADSVTVERIAVPCSALALSEAPFPPAQAKTDPEGSTAKWLSPKDGATALLRSPSGEGSIRVKADAIRVSGSGDGPLRVSMTMDDGARLTGWAARDSLQDEGGGGRGYGWGGGGCGCSGVPTDLEVTIPTGTDVFAGPGDGRWARVTAPITLQGRAAGAEWIQVAGIRGLSETQTYYEGGCHDLEHAFVLRASVRVRQPKG